MSEDLRPEDVPPGWIAFPRVPMAVRAEDVGAVSESVVIKGGEYVSCVEMLGHTGTPLLYATGVSLRDVMMALRDAAEIRHVGRGSVVPSMSPQDWTAQGYDE